MDAFLARVSPPQIREWLAEFYLQSEEARDRQIEAEASARARANSRGRR